MEKYANIKKKIRSELFFSRQRFLLFKNFEAIASFKILVNTLFLIFFAMSLVLVPHFRDLWSYLCECVFFLCHEKY